MGGGRWEVGGGGRMKSVCIDEAIWGEKGMGEG